MTIQGPGCGRTYDALRDCQLYDPKRRPLRAGMQATVRCACGREVEVTVKQRPIRKLLPLPRRVWEFYLDIKER
jgi:hypothetical protein